MVALDDLPALVECCLRLRQALEESAAPREPVRA
jgi:hypothetical protein